jgi:mRNA-degrading endonuclease RelE of RelBE toxin-antitoxin system
MSFRVFLSKDIFKNIPNERKNHIKDALFELEDPLPGGNKAEIEGSKDYFKQRIGKKQKNEIRLFLKITKEKL